jgi:hypothetical protein
MLMISSQKRCKYFLVSSGKNIPVFGGFDQRSSTSMPDLGLPATNCSEPSLLISHFLMSPTDNK